MVANIYSAYSVRHCPKSELIITTLILQMRKLRNREVI